MTAPLSFDLLILDVDGTLVGEEGDPSPRLLAALREAQSRGIGICLCTGRPLRATQRYLQALDGAVPPVVFNGALVPSLVPGHVPLLCEPLPPECLAALVSHARAHGDYLELHTAEAYYVERLGKEGAYQGQKFGYGPLVGPFPTSWTEPILKAQFVVHTVAQQERLRALADALAEQMTFSWGVSPGYEGHFVNVMRRGVDKGAALDLLLVALGIPWKRVFAAGDSPSDLGYIRRAGYGLVMGNAPPQVRTQAPHLGRSVEEDGLALAIERVVLGKCLLPK